MPTRPLILLAMVSAAACSSSGAIRPATDRVVMVDERTGTTLRTGNDQAGSRAVIAAPVDSVWEAVAASYAMLGVTRTFINQATGEQGNLRLVMSRKFFNQPVSSYLNCGDDPFSGPNANAHPVTVSLITRVRPEGTGSTIQTLLSGTVNKTGANSGAIYCATSGALEEHIAKMVASRVVKN